jgi:hypothetical protein
VLAAYFLARAHDTLGSGTKVDIGSSVSNVDAQTSLV